MTSDKPCSTSSPDFGRRAFTEDRYTGWRSFRVTVGSKDSWRRSELFRRIGLMGGEASWVPMWLQIAAERTPPTFADPGLGATVSTPPPALLIAGWVLGVIALAILWAVSRK